MGESISLGFGGRRLQGAAGGEKTSLQCYHYHCIAVVPMRAVSLNVVVRDHLSWHAKRVPTWESESRPRVVAGQRWFTTRGRASCPLPHLACASTLAMCDIDNIPRRPSAICQRWVNQLALVLGEDARKGQPVAKKHANFVIILTNHRRVSVA